MDIEKKPQSNTFRLNPADSRFDLSLKNSFGDEWAGKGINHDDAFRVWEIAPAN